MNQQAMEVLLNRRSVRAYRPEQIAPEELEAVLQAGAFAPSARGRQPCRVVAVQDAQTVAKLEAMNAAILGAPDAKPFYGAPTVLIVFADSQYPTCVEDGSLVMGNLMNAAYAAGLGSCWIHRAREEFTSPEGKALMAQWGIGDGYIGIGHCILGYEAGEHPAPRPRREDFAVRV